METLYSGVLNALSFRPMAMKRTVSTTVISDTPEAAASSPFYDRPFWEIVHSLSPNEWKNHLVRVYRADDRWEGAGSVPNGKMQEDFDEDTILKNWGGGRYLLWMYGPPLNTSGQPCKVVMARVKVEIEGAPIFASATGSGTSNGGGGGGGTALEMLVRELLTEIRASRSAQQGGPIVQTAMSSALDIQAQALRSGIEASRSMMAPLPAPPDPMAEITRTILTAMVTKMLNPGNPMDEFKMMMGTVKELAGMVGATGGGKPDLMGTLLAQFPTIMEKGVAGIHEYRLANEANERAIALQKQAPRVIDSQVVDPVAAAGAPGVDPAAVPAASQPAEPQTVEVKGPSMEWLFLKIKAAIEDPESTGEDLYDFLRNVDPGLLDQLAVQTPEEIMRIFQHQILKPVATNPRLPKLIDEFLKAAKEQ